VRNQNEHSEILRKENIINIVEKTELTVQHNFEIFNILGTPDYFVSFLV